MQDRPIARNRLARLFSLHQSEAIAEEEPPQDTRLDSALSDEQIARWQEAAVKSLRG